jgi:hypothetical protein
MKQSAVEPCRGESILLRDVNRLWAARAVGLNGKSKARDFLQLVASARDEIRGRE